MPYTVKKVGKKYVISKKNGGKVVGKSDSKAKAMASVAARMKADDPTQTNAIETDETRPPIPPTSIPLVAKEPKRPNPFKGSRAS